MTEPTVPIELTGTAEHLTGPSVALPDGLADGLSAICVTDTGVAATAEASRDWWPVALHWSLEGEVPRRAAAVVRPTSTEQLAAVLATCNDAHVPVTAAGGRSGVCGASVPVFGGVVLSTTALA